MQIIEHGNYEEPKIHYAECKDFRILRIEEVVGDGEEG